MKNARMIFIGFQHEVFRDLQAEVNYVGQRASNLITSSSSSDSGRVINAGWNGTGGTFDQNYYSLGSRLNARIANPFKGLIPQPSSLAGDTITVAQLLMPYPEFGNIATDLAGNCFMCIDQNHVLLFWLQVVSAIALPNRSTTSLSYRTAV